MSAVLTRRVVLLLPTLLVTSLLVFFVLALGPSPLAHLRETGQLAPADVARIAAEHGWDQPLPVQYLHWLGGVVTGDMGESVRTLKPAGALILERLPLTLTIASLALVLSVGIGLPLGALVAVRQDTRVDHFTTLITLLMMAAPAFFVALVLQIIAVKLREWTGGVVFYTSGIPETGANPGQWVQRLALPVATLTLTHIAIWVRYQRGELLGVLGQEYIRSARAKGLPERVVFLRHAMRNALLPIITLIAIDMGKLVAGAVIVESVFGLPGIGSLLLDSALNNDAVVVLDIIMIMAVMMVASNTLADLAYGALDPRVRDGAK